MNTQETGQILPTLLPPDDRGPRFSVVLFIWKLPSSLLDGSLYTLSHQTYPPLEIVLVNACPDSVLAATYHAACKPYPLVRVVDAPQATLNLSRSLNVGVRASDPAADYIITTQVELVFSANVLEILSNVMCPDVCGQSQRGDLPIGVEIGDAATVWERWQSLKAQIVPNPPLSVSPGTIICITRPWWFEVRGYDEIRTPYNYNDSDLLFRAQWSGLRSAVLTWDKCQIFHRGHPHSPEYYAIRSQYPSLGNGTVRNPVTWGEIA